MKANLRICLFLFCLSSLSLKTNAGVVTEVATDAQLLGVTDLATDGVNIYFTPSFTNPKIGVVSINGGTVNTLYGQLTSPLGITLVGSDLFWIDPNAGGGTGTAIFSAPKTGSGPITTIYDSGSFIIDGSGITTNGSKLFTADEVQGRVHSLNLDGSGVTQIGPNRYGGFFNTEHLNNIAEHGGTLYIADSGRAGVIDPQIVSISTSGGVFTPLLVGAPFVRLTGIAVSDDTIFVSDAGTNTIWGLPLVGGSLFEVAKDSRFKNLGGLTYFDGDLYVADNGDSTTGTIWKVDVSAVPEPSTIASASLATVAGLFMVRRRRRSA